MKVLSECVFLIVGFYDDWPKGVDTDMLESRVESWIANINKSRVQRFGVNIFSHLVAIAAFF